MHVETLVSLTTNQVSLTRHRYHLKHSRMDHRWSGSLQVEQWIHVSETECYCPVSDQWTTLTLSPFSRCQFSVTAHRSTLYLTGGGLLQHMRKEDSVYLYDTEGQVWKRAGPLPRALVDHASCMVKLPQANTAGEPRRGTEHRLTSRRQKATLSLLAAKRQGPSTASKGK